MELAKQRSQGLWATLLESMLAGAGATILLYGVVTTFFFFAVELETARARAFSRP